MKSCIQFIISIQKNNQHKYLCFFFFQIIIRIKLISQINHKIFTFSKQTKFIFNSWIKKIITNRIFNSTKLILCIHNQPIAIYRINIISQLLIRIIILQANYLKANCIKNSLFFSLLFPCDPDLKFKV